MDQDKSVIEKVILPSFLHEYAIERGNKTSSEVGFYIIGLIQGNIAYCYDLIEFDYYEQTPVYLETNFAKDFRLRAGLPIGLEILGIMHKHPGQMLSYSSTDKETFIKYAHDTYNRNVFMIYVLNPDNLQAYNATYKKIFKIDHEIRDFILEEELMTYFFTIPINFQVCGPKNSNIQSLRFNLINEASHEVSKCLSRPILLNDYREISDKELLMNFSEIEVMPFVPIDIKLGQNSQIVYRFFMPPNANIEDLYEKLVQDFKISSGLRLFFKDEEIDEKIRLSKIVGKLLELKKKKFQREGNISETIEKLTKSVNSLRIDMEEIALQNRGIRDINEQFEKIQKSVKEIEERLKKLEGKGKKDNSKTTLDEFMGYG